MLYKGYITVPCCTARLPPTPSARSSSLLTRETVVQYRSVNFANPSAFRKGFRESRRCSRDTYPESYITEYTSVYEEKEATQRAWEGCVPCCTARLRWPPSARSSSLLTRERIFVELMTSDHKLKASREGSKSHQKYPWQVMQSLQLITPKFPIGPPNCDSVALQVSP